MDFYLEISKFSEIFKILGLNTSSSASCQPSMECPKFKLAFKEGLEKKWDQTNLGRTCILDVELKARVHNLFLKYHRAVEENRIIFFF